MRYQLDAMPLGNSPADVDLHDLIQVLNTCSVLLLVNIIAIVAAFELG